MTKNSKSAGNKAAPVKSAFRLGSELKPLSLQSGIYESNERAIIQVISDQFSLQPERPSERLFSRAGSEIPNQVYQFGNNNTFNP